MDAQLDHKNEPDGIAKAYGGWHGGMALARTAWHRPDIVYQHAMCTRVISRVLATPWATTSARCASSTSAAARAASCAS